MEKIKELRYEEASRLIFGEVLRKAENQRAGAREITQFFTVTPK